LKLFLAISSLSC